MDKFFHSVRLNPDLCKGCTHCLKRCPTEAIRVRNGKASINEKFCIDCGECIRVCPHHAKIAYYDDLSSLHDFSYTIALPAPSLYAQFNHLTDPNIVLNALLALGFDEVFEVSAAAELVSQATRELLDQPDAPRPYISTACPTIVRLIRVRFPNLLPHLLQLNPPVELAAMLSSERAMKKTGLPREKIGVFFISPCPSKVAYAKAPLGIAKSDIDRVLAIKDLYPLLLPEMKEAAKQTDLPDHMHSGRIGISWGRSGGEASGLFTDSYLAADGIENAIRVLEDLEDEKLPGLRFVELNACPGGCVGGVLQIENPYVAEVKLNYLRKYLPVSVAQIQEAEKSMIPWEHEIQYEPVFNLGNSMIESMSRLQQVERLTHKLPELDCGCCGAPSCKSLAEDIVKGNANLTDCIYLMKEKMNKLLKEHEKRNSISTEDSYDCN